MFEKLQTLFLSDRSILIVYKWKVVWNLVRWTHWDIAWSTIQHFMQQTDLVCMKHIWIDDQLLLRGCLWYYISWFFSIMFSSSQNGQLYAGPNCKILIRAPYCTSTLIQILQLFLYNGSINSIVPWHWHTYEAWNFLMNKITGVKVAKHIQ